MGVNIYTTKKTSEQMEKERIIEMHRRAVNIEFKRFNIISEQDVDWKEKSYVKPLTDAGYTQVQEINLPDGTYKKYGGGYRVEISDGSDVPTGYVIVTNNGIRGSWGGDDLEIAGKKTNENTYKIFYKDVGYKPTNVGVDFINVLKTIDEQYLIKGAIPSEIISASAPSVKVINGQGNFEISGKKYAFDFKQTLPGVNGKYYFLTESATYLNQNATNYGIGNSKADEGTQFAGFVDNFMSGVIIYVMGGSIVTYNGTFK